jgi:hypothetical protein
VGGRFGDNLFFEDFDTLFERLREVIEIKQKYQNKLKNSAHFLV